MDTTKSGKSFLDFLTRNSKKFIIGLVVLTGITLVSAGAIWWSYTRPIATINGEKITRADVTEGVDKYKKVFEYNNDSNSLNDINSTVKKLLIEQAIVKTEAEKRNLTASEEEIDSLYNEYRKSYKSDEEMQSAIFAAYSWTETDVRKSLAAQILKQKLIDQVVNKRNLTFIYFRYDFGGDEGLQLANPAMEAVYQNLKNGATIEAETNRIKALGGDTWIMPHFGTNTIKGVNEANETDYFSGREDWQAIKELATTGGLSGIVKSSGGYLAVYRLDAITNGSYSSWGVYVESFTKTAFKSNNLAGFLTDKLVSKANAACPAALPTVNGCCVPGTSQSHYGWIGGVVFTITGVELGGAYVSASIVIDPAQYPPLCTNTGVMLNTSAITGPYPAGGYTAGWFWLGKNGDTKLLPCYWQWQVTADASGYITGGPNRLALTNGVGGSTIFYLSPVPPPKQRLSVTKTGTGAGTVSSNPIGINCGSDCSEDYNINTAVALTAAPATGSTFTGWSGGGCSGTGVCNVTMNVAKTVTANFTLRTYTVTATASPAGSGTFTGTGTFNYGGSTTLTATAKTGYNTTPTWSGNCSGTTITYAFSNITANKACTASFVASVTYTLSYNGNGNTSGTAPNPQAGNLPGTRLAVAGPGNLAKVCNVFSYWSIVGFTYNPSDIYTIQTNRTAYATWAPNSYSISYNANGGSGAPTAQSASYDSTTTLSSTVPTRAGYSFIGWNTNASGTGTSYASGASYGPMPCNGVTLYANFSQTTYTLSTSVASGSGSVSGAGPYNSGTTAYPVATPSGGWGFSSWNGDCAGQGASASVLMNGNKSCGANFYWINTPPAVTLVSPIGNPTLGSGVTSTTLEAFSVDDGNSQTMDFQLYGPSGNLIRESGWISPYFTNNTHQTFAVSGLTSGTYRWRAQSYDGNLISAWVEDFFTVPVIRNLTCAVSPVSGVSPLVVKVTVTPTNVSPPYSYRMNASKPLDLLELTNQEQTIYYTYAAAGPYQVQAYNSAVGSWIACSPEEITVKNQDSTDGGEVRP